MKELRTRAEEMLKMEEMMTQLELAKIQEQASQQSEHNLTSGGIRSVNGRVQNSRCPNYLLLWTEKLILILGYFDMSDSLP